MLQKEYKTSFNIDPGIMKIKQNLEAITL